MAFIETAIITAKIAQLSLGLGGFSGAEVNNHANQSLAELTNRNTVTLSSPELAPDYQSGIVECPWINPFPDGSRPLDGADTPPHVTCELFQDPNGGLPTLRVYVSNWPEDKASMVAFSFKGSDTVIVAVHPDSATVNLQTICGVRPLNQWFLRGMSGWVWQSGDFIETEAASIACFRGINESTTINILDPATGLQKQFLFDPTQSGLNGNLGAFQPFRRNQYDTNKIFFEPTNEESARTLTAMQLAIQEQLKISTGKDIIVWPSMSYSDPTRLLERIPLPTPTPEPTAQPTATPEYVYVEPPAAIVTAIEQSLPEIINNPISKIGIDLLNIGNDVTVYIENPLATERTGLINYINALNATVDQKTLDAQYSQIEDVNPWEWIKSLWGGYEYALSPIGKGSISMARILHINFDKGSDRTIIIDGLDANGKFMRIIMPAKGNVTVNEDKSITFKSKTRIKFNATDTTGAPDEATQTLSRLTEQIANYYDIGSHPDTLPEVVVVPIEAVPVLYRDSADRNSITFAAQSLREKYPTVNVTLAYYDADGAQHLVTNFLLPTGMLGKAKQVLTFNGSLVYEVDISLISDLVNGNTIPSSTLAFVKNQIPPEVTYGSSFTIYVPSDNIAAIPSDKFNPLEPTPGPATPTHTPSPTPPPSSYLPPATAKLVSELAERKVNEWAHHNNTRSKRMQKNRTNTFA